MIDIDIAAGRIIAGLAAAALVTHGAVAGGAYLNGRADGRAIERAAIMDFVNRRNEEAGNAAEGWRGEYRRCVDAGGVFDFEAGACVR
jgi:hypothetical protein